MSSATENASFSTSPFRYHTGGRRFVAVIVDGLLVTWMTAIVTGLASAAPHPTFWFAWAVSTLAVPWYYILFHAQIGKTPGKWLLGVVVVDESETRGVTLNQATWREMPLLVVTVLHVTSAGYYTFTYPDLTHEPLLLQILGWCEFVWYIAELVTMLSNHRRRAIHDFLGGSVVLRTK
jgi:uncharacterized RDD family membrane protein YckC